MELLYQLIFVTHICLHLATNKKIGVPPILCVHRTFQPMFAVRQFSNGKMAISV